MITVEGHAPLNLAFTLWWSKNYGRTNFWQHTRYDTRSMNLGVQYVNTLNNCYCNACINKQSN